MKKLSTFLFIALLSFSTNYLLAEVPYYLDIKYILNESTAGKKAQKKLKEILDTSIKNLNEREKKLQAEEKKLSIKKNNFS